MNKKYNSMNYASSIKGTFLQQKENLNSACSDWTQLIRTIVLYFSLMIGLNWNTTILISGLQLHIIPPGWIILGFPLIKRRHGIIYAGLDNICAFTDVRKPKKHLLSFEVGIISLVVLLCYLNMFLSTRNTFLFVSTTPVR